MGARSGNDEDLNRAARRSKTRIYKWNLFWGFAYYASGIPIAAGLLYPFSGLLLTPIVAGAATAFSSVFAVSNSLQIRGFRPAMAAV